MRSLACVGLILVVAGCTMPNSQATDDGGDCDASPASCGVCATDGDCTGGANPRCDTLTKHCVACLPQADNCAMGTHCISSGQIYVCAITCVTDRDCPSVGGLPEICCGNACVNPASDIANCGGCNKPCSALSNSTPACVSGACGIKTCNDGFANCDNITSNGCETPLAKDPNNCGLCGKTCVTGNNAMPACKSSACTTTCDSFFADCDGDVKNGCEVYFASDPMNCGGCKKTCTAPPNATPTCTNSKCAVGQCAAGFGDCNNKPVDGCEVNINSDPNNCGSCGNACPPIANASSACTNGQCALSACNAGFADCNMDLSDGCEINLANDLANCGACSAVCQFANGAGSCVNQKCTFQMCNAGFADCNSNLADGCEAGVATDKNNCGACGMVCKAAPNLIVSCANSKCATGNCVFGFADCNMNAADGCEVSLTTTSNCGFCGNTCGAVTNATPGCNGGTCGIGMCTALYGNCDNNASNGCERPLASDTANCGACNHQCSLPNAAPLCLGGQCGIASCFPNYADCNGMPVDGCEANKLSDKANCGGCGNSCMSGANAGGICNNGQCAFACNSGFADCDSSAGDGCEINTNTDLKNCGACANACTVPANATAGCNLGVCGIGMCAMGFADCNKSALDGCEKNVFADVNNCGACSMVCNVPNAVAGCLNAQCGVASCNAGYSDCDGLPANGCESTTGTDVKNCGACGRACAAGDVCLNGQCNCPTCNLPNATAECVNNQCVFSQCKPGYSDCNNNPADGCEANFTFDPNNCGMCGNACPLIAPYCTDSYCSVDSFPPVYLLYLLEED